MQNTVRARKQWNGKTTLNQFLCAFNAVTKQIFLVDTIIESII